MATTLHTLATLITAAKRSFDRGHRLSVIVNILQLAAAIGMFIHLLL